MSTRRTLKRRSFAGSDWGMSARGAPHPSQRLRVAEGGLARMALGTRGAVY